MHDDPFDIAFAQIAESDLKPIYLRTAVRLLHACPGTGHVRKTWPDFFAITGCNDKGGARRHLTNLCQAGVIKYHTNEEISVDFVAYIAQDVRVGAQDLRAGAQDVRVDAQKLRVPRSDLGDNFGDQNGHAQDVRVDAQKLRAGAQNVRVGAQKLRAGGDTGGEGWQDGWIKRFNRLKDPSIQPSSYAPPVEGERDLNQKMLHSLGVPADLAEHIATIFQPEEIYSQGLRYIADREDPKRESPRLGALMHRLADPRGFPPQPPTEEDERTPFAERYGPLLREFRWRQKNPEEAAEIDAEAAARPPTDRTGEESERD